MFYEKHIFNPFPRGAQDLDLPNYDFKTETIDVKEFNLLSISEEIQQRNIHKDTHNAIVNGGILSYFKYRTPRFDNINTYVSNIRLVLHFDDKDNIDKKVVKECKLEINGSRINRISDSQQLDVHNWYNNQKETVIENDNTLIYPLSMFFKYLPNPVDCNLSVCVGLDATHLIRFEIKYDIYYCTGKDCFPPMPSINSFLVQTQFGGTDCGKQGKNKFKLSFNHCVFLLYFYGLDKTKITNIKLGCDDTIVYDGDVQTLDILKQEKGIDISDDILVITFDTLFHKDKLNKTINYSRIDNPYLMIDTTEEYFEINICALNYHSFTMTENNFALKYSK